MGDIVITTRLEALAEAAGELLRGLVASGEEIPFELTGPGEGTPFAQYTPMSGRFVREHWSQLSELDSFGDACAEIERTGVAGDYLERLDEPVPPDQGRRAEAAAINFLAGLWPRAADFPLDRDRLAAAISELEGCVTDGGGDAELVAPLLGFQMPTVRLELGDATIVRADLVDVPDEARRPDGTTRAAGESLFLAVVKHPIPLDDVDGSAASPGSTLRHVVRTLRLFKHGGVGLGPYAWARTPGDRWRRLPTGAPRPRPGGYRLAEPELGDLPAFARAVSGRPLSGPIARAISRFEAGLERAALLEALSDNVVALRHLLEGGGPAGVGLGMRAAALLAEPAKRPDVRRRIERAVALEGEVVRGELPRRDDGPGPLELAAEVEELTRTLLRDAVDGGLGSDLRAAADEALLADGLAAGEGAVEVRGATAEWDAIGIDEEQPAADPVAPRGQAEDATGPDLQEIGCEPPTTELMDTKQRDWLSEVDSDGDTLDWPQRPEALKILDRRPQERERARRRVRHLFPRPETTEWRVAELQYERRKARV